MNYSCNCVNPYLLDFVIGFLFKPFIFGDSSSITESQLLETHHIGYIYSAPKLIEKLENIMASQDLPWKHDPIYPLVN